MKKYKFKAMERPEYKNPLSKKGRDIPVHSGDLLSLNLGKYLARKFWDGLHDHPKASHVRDMTFDEYFNINKDEYIGEASALIGAIRQG